MDSLALEKLGRPSVMVRPRLLQSVDQFEETGVLQNILPILELLPNKCATGSLTTPIYTRHHSTMLQDLEGFVSAYPVIWDRIVARTGAGHKVAALIPE